MTGICDSCNSRTTWEHGYVLATRTVVISEGFWRGQFEALKAVVTPMNFDETQHVTLFDSSIRRHASSTTPWLVCEKCIDMFVCDRAVARSLALRRGEPEGGGAVDPGGCAQIAAIVWEGVFGRWPSTVRRPSVRDSCDFCARKIYAGEMAGNIKRETADELRAAGMLDTPPLGPVRSDGTGWRACQGCTVRLASKTMRVRERQGR